jgi:hypothetical protein
MEQLYHDLFWELNWFKEKRKMYNMTLQIWWCGLIIYDAITKRVLNTCIRSIKQGAEIIF